MITKVAGDGGRGEPPHPQEQLFYEVHDPAHYITPDVVVDFTTTRLDEVGHDRVRVSAISGKPRTPTFKVSIACQEGFIGEDMFFYAGPGALRRARLARRILEERFRIVGLDAEEIRIDFVGANAIHGGGHDDGALPEGPEPAEIAVRVAARTRTREEALKVGREVDGMAVSGVGMTGKRVPHQDRTPRDHRRLVLPRAPRGDPPRHHGLRELSPMRLPLQHVAHVRSGDKGNTSNVTVIAYEPDLYPLLKEHSPPSASRRTMPGMVTGPVTRHAVDGLGVLNFVAEGALGGGVSRSLCLDNYGKALSAAILAFEMEVPDTMANLLRNHRSEP